MSYTAYAQGAWALVGLSCAHCCVQPPTFWYVSTEPLALRSTHRTARAHLVQVTTYTQPKVHSLLLEGVPRQTLTPASKHHCLNNPLYP